MDHFEYSFDQPIRGTPLAYEFERVRAQQYSHNMCVVSDIRTQTCGQLFIRAEWASCMWGWVASNRCHNEIPRPARSQCKNMLQICRNMCRNYCISNRNCRNCRNEKWLRQANPFFIVSTVSTVSTRIIYVSTIVSTLFVPASAVLRHSWHQWGR